MPIIELVVANMYNLAAISVSCIAVVQSKLIRCKITYFFFFLGGGVASQAKLHCVNVQQSENLM